MQGGPCSGGGGAWCRAAAASGLHRLGVGGLMSGHSRWCLVSVGCSFVSTFVQCTLMPFCMSEVP